MKYLALLALFATAQAADMKKESNKMNEKFEDWWPKYAGEGSMNRDTFGKMSMELFAKDGWKPASKEEEELANHFIDAMFKMGSEGNKEMDYKQGQRLWDYYTYDYKSAMNKDGSWDTKKLFDDEDYNRDGKIDTTEVFNAMIRGEFEPKMMEEAWKFMEPYFGGENGAVDYDTYVKMMEDYKAYMGSKKGGSGPRMEIHMEENADGSAKLTIIMESARKLAVSAAAVATAAFFSS